MSGDFILGQNTVAHCHIIAHFLLFPIQNDVLAFVMEPDHAKSMPLCYLVAAVGLKTDLQCDAFSVGFSKEIRIPPPLLLYHPTCEKSRRL